MRLLAAVFAAASVALAAPPVADFETPESAKPWAADAGAVEIVKAPAHAGTGALRWTSPKEGARLACDAVHGDLTPHRAIRFFAYLEGTVDREMTLKVRTKGGDFARRFPLRPQVWSEIVVPFYQFRQEGLPRWDKVEALEFVARRPVTVVLDDVGLVEGGDDPQIEPGGALVERIFPEAAPKTALTENFRVFTDAAVDPAAVAARLEEGLASFRKIFAIEEPLAWPVTLIIRPTVDEYRRTAVETARDVYGGELAPPTAGGFTFYEYSFASYDEKYGATRPVFLHEAFHQIVTRLQGFHGANGAMWIEEGLCYFMQNEFTPIENAREESLKLLDNPKRPALASFDGKQRIDSGAENLEAFLVVHFLLKGPHAAKWADFVEALRENDTHLLKAAEEALSLKPSDFETEWVEFTRKWAAEK